MKRIMSAAAVGIALSYPVFYAGPAAAQALSNPQVQVVYARPRAANLQPVANRLKSRRVLEEFAQFMLPLKLPATLTVQFDQCGGNTRIYKPGEPATICYELVDQIEKIAAKSPDDEEMMLAGAVTQAVFHAAANAVFDILDVPIWGRREDAADRLAGFIMMEIGSDLAYWTIIGTTSFFEDSGKTWTGSQFAEASSPEAQRYFDYLCMAYGGDPVQFGYLAKQPEDKNEKPVLPKDRADQCRDEYTQIRSAFNLRIMPYVDPDLLVKVRATKWAISSRRK
jgi:Putative metallopeptidase